MYPGTIFNWFDQSEIRQDETIADLDNSPLFAVVSSFDKGPEDLREVAGATFNSLFGKMYFEKHGQNAIQAQRIINAGGRLLVKRVCAEDSTIANVVFVATLSSTEEQKLDSNGKPIYLDESGAETIVETANPVKITKVKVKWEAKNISGCKTFDQVKEEAEKLFNDETGVYPLIVVTDNGRGVSGKAFRLIPDYNTSKSIGKTFYSATVFEGTTSTETVPVTFDPTVIQSGAAYGMEKSTMTQVSAEVVDNVYNAYNAKIASLLNVDENTFRDNDLVYGYSYKGNTLDNFAIDAESIDMNANYGVELKEGSNGAFGDKPVNTEVWAEAMRKVWAGEVTDEIWDVDQHKISAICDANLPYTVKEAIAQFVNFRKDCVFFRDLGINLNSFLQIKTAYEKIETKSRFIADYATSYLVKDPVTKKNIKVTMMYDFVECLVNHVETTPYNPLAGIANSFVLTEVIKGSINYTPIVTPSVNQKQAMEDLRVNYAIFEGDDCVVQTLYTSQDLNSQLSYINNVLAIQQVARAVRTACPRNRYTIVSGSDMTSYAKAVSNVLTAFAGNFNTLEFSYTRDKLKSAQKLFYASITFSFNDWAQTEVFDLFAINND